MKVIDAIIYSLPIEKIDTVYLVGKVNDYYKLYIEQKNSIIFRIDLKISIEQNFSRLITVESVHRGEYTHRLSTEEAIKLLNFCNWENALKPNLKTLSFTKEILRIKNFKQIKKEIDNRLPFFFWIKKQVERDDLIGDIAYDISRDYDIGLFKTYKELESYISFKQTGYWEINTFNDSKKKLGRVSPLLCLKLAKMEYDIYQKKAQLKEFRIVNTEGYIYFLKPEHEDGPIKIGRARNITQRINQLQTSLPYDLKLVGYIETSNCIELENEIHRIYQNKNLKREWFNIKLDDVIHIIEKYNGKIINNRVQHMV